MPKQDPPLTRFQDEGSVGAPRMRMRDAVEAAAGGAEAQAWLAAIVESADDAIISKRLDGTITSWNPAARKLFGYEAFEMVGESVFKLIPPELHGEEHEILARIRRGERVHHYETV